MPRRVPLPPEFDPPFRVSDARRKGVGEGRLRGLDLARTFYGVRARATAPDPNDHPTRVLALRYAPRLREGDRFSHTTAAALWGCPVDAETVVHVTATLGGVRPRGARVEGHRSTTGRTVLRAELPVSDPATTFLEIATQLPLDALVRAGDYLVHDPHVLDPYDIRPHVRLAELRDQLQGHTGRGIRLAREAAELVREGAESPTETDLRLLLARAGFPEPILGYELNDERGRFVGFFDLAWTDARVFVEYDGDGHRTSKEQYERDIRRFDAAADLGWRTIRVRRYGLYVNPDDTIRRVAAALGRGGVHRMTPRGRRST